MAKRSILAVLSLLTLAGFLSLPGRADATVKPIIAKPTTADGGPIPMCDPNTGKCKNICPQWPHICN